MAASGHTSTPFCFVVRQLSEAFTQSSYTRGVHSHLMLFDTAFDGYYDQYGISIMQHWSQIPLSLNKI